MLNILLAIGIGTAAIVVPTIVIGILHMLFDKDSPFKDLD